MRVIYIVPAAFEYFNDIKNAAFNIAGKIADFGVQVDISTLEYKSAPTHSEKVARQKAVTSHEYTGQVPIANLLESLKSYDIVHLHCPFLGAAGKILEWKKNHPKVPLIVTYYRTVPWSDLISVFISFYNSYYLKKIFTAAEIVTYVDKAMWKKSKFSKIYEEKSLALPVKNRLEGLSTKGIAEDLSILYNIVLGEEVNY